MKKNTVYEYDERLEGSQDDRPRRRMGRGKLILIDGRSSGRSNSAEMEPESSFSTDEALTWIGLRSANSDNNEAILREQAAAADRVAHIFRGVSPSSREILEGELGRHEEPRQPYRSECERAYEDARRADHFEIFAKHCQTQPAYQPYNPRGIMMEDYNQTRSDACLSFFGDQRTSVGIDRPGGDASQPCTKLCEPTVKADPAPTHERPTVPSTVHRPSNGCEHVCRQWQVLKYGYIKLVCLGCGEVFKVCYAFAG